MIRLISAIGILLLAGCTAVPGVPTHLKTVNSAIQQSGGAFSASHSGNLNTNGGCVPPDGSGTFKFSGKGPGSFIGRNFESGSMFGNVGVGCNWSGSATLTSLAHPGNSLTVGLTLTGFQTGWPCAPRFGARVKWNVTSGTGKFVHATGNGTVKFTCSGYSTYTDQWSGTISF